MMEGFDPHRVFEDARRQQAEGLEAALRGPYRIRRAGSWLLRQPQLENPELGCGPAAPWLTRLLRRFTGWRG